MGHSHGYNSLIEFNGYDILGQLAWVSWLIDIPIMNESPLLVGRLYNNNTTQS